MREVCNAVKGHFLQAMKIVHHNANGRFDWLRFGHQSVTPSREVIFIMSGNYKRFTFVHPVAAYCGRLPLTNLKDVIQLNRNLR